VVDGQAGQTAVAIAREAITVGLLEESARDPARRFRERALDPVFDERRGVFVTLRRYPDGALRGCIGFPRPVHPLRVGIPRAAWSAAVEDPRFPPLSSGELPHTVVEVSILTPPVPLPGNDPAERPHRIRVGTDGLIVQGYGTSGLLLPQVAVEEHWSALEFLSFACRKAGLPENAWKEPDVEVLRFQAEVFAETAPGGGVEVR
jgi:uncharacterized protein (TIGR00296 family)